MCVASGLSIAKKNQDENLAGFDTDRPIKQFWFLELVD